MDGSQHLDRDDADREQVYNGLAEKMLRYVETNTTDQTDDVLRVPVSAYTDPAQWSKEIELIFKRQPLMLAMTIELPNPGDYKAMEVIGLPILLTRARTARRGRF